MNSVNLIGRLVRDGKEIVTQNGMRLIYFTIAVQERGKTEFIFCKLATKSEKVASLFTKGRRCSVVGKLQSYKKDGRTEMLVFTNRVEFLDKKGVRGEPTAPEVQIEEEPF